MEAEGFGHRASWRGRCGSRREGDGAGGRGGNRVPIGGGEWRVKALDAAAAAVMIEVRRRRSTSRRLPIYYQETGPALR